MSDCISPKCYADIAREKSPSTSASRIESPENRSGSPRVDTHRVVTGSVGNANRDVVANNPINASLTDVSSTSAANANDANADADTDTDTRHITARDLELLWLESACVVIFCEFGHEESVSFRRRYYAENNITPPSPCPIKEPDPTGPPSVHPQPGALGESEISSLDIGPEIGTDNPPTPPSLRGSTLTSLSHNVDFARTAGPELVSGPGDDSNGPSEHQRLESETTLVFPAHDELRQPPDPEHDDHGCGDRFSDCENGTEYFSEESSRRIYSLSVPNSPTPRTAVSRPALFRSMSSFGGMDPEFFAMRTAHQTRQTGERTEKESSS
ncbi:uncharacterized protein N7515_005953 [Penicillium bovifimosum]|uniref:Uncharacterized protein n=1 Tax=Penicillium bovifimosum TaxID=126998 RepID=A0A9W9GTQ2_9EURO|nr:uncharacterized protein N7515_005953 [Penicillium bovifimosum]KAJ5129914.1 hypothetical protein N7515_005953 [Penicillium bovifimosum]